jgi:hypothetical protein
MLELIQSVCSNPDISVMQGLMCLKRRFNKKYDGSWRFMDYGDFKFHENNQTVTLKLSDLIHWIIQNCNFKSIMFE